MLKIATNLYSKIVCSLFFAMFLWWLFIFTNELVDTTQNFLYGAALGVLPVVGSIFGFINAKKWGGFRSAMGRAVNFLSAGLATWGVGTLIFAYYNIFLDVAVPYPSLADAFYIISWPLWAISMINLSKATGVKFQLRNVAGRLMFFLIPLFTAIASYYLLIVVARGGVISESGDLLKTFFDVAYPIGDIVILTVAFLVYGLSFNYLGGFFRWPILVVLIGFFANYIGDFTFVLTVTKETYFVANWVDLIYTTAFFLLSFGVSIIDPHPMSSQKE